MDLSLSSSTLRT